jgi:aminopeptidase N
MAASAMVQAQNAVRVFEKYFGPLPYGRLAITQQPDFNFGQSWPTLVYLPVSAFLDSTQRWRLMGASAFKFANFIEEVTPHEVSHQWWGHMVSWATYHDQWLSEGFADFSAGLYLQMTEQKPDRFNRYWERQRQRILEKNEYGLSGNDAGPVWMGLRLDSFKSAQAYNRVVYAKGGYVLHMLRQLMRDPKNSDTEFIAMMQDFVKTYANRSASTEDFKAIAEKHMPPGLDLERNHRLDWFFRQWVYGTEIPKYRLEYSLTQQEDGKTLLKGALTQSGVSETFRMMVPLYAEIDGRIVWLGLLSAAGSTTGKEFRLALASKPKRVFLNAFQDVLASEATSTISH